LGIPAGVRGALIDGVARGSKAEQAGLRANDVIVSVSGQTVNTTRDLWGAQGGLNGAEPIELGLYRNGQLMSLTLPTEAGALAGGFGGWDWGWGAGGTPANPAPPGEFRGRMGGQGWGPGGTLVCPTCRTTVTHQRGVPCYTVACPSCGTSMTRLR
jgi:hypothetical protein